MLDFIFNFFCFCPFFEVVYILFHHVVVIKRIVNFTFTYNNSFKAWEFLLFARPRFEAFALPGIVERATQRPHAGYVYTNMLHAGNA